MIEWCLRRAAGQGVFLVRFTMSYSYAQFI